MNFFGLQRVFLACAFATVAVNGAASERQTTSVQLDKPLAGASLHIDDIDMAIYFEAGPDLYDVVATYAAQSGPYAPARFRIGLGQNGSVSVTLPGHPDQLFNFTRSGGGISVHATNSTINTHSTTPAVYTVD